MLQLNISRKEMNEIERMNIIEILMKINYALMSK